MKFLRRHYTFAELYCMRKGLLRLLCAPRKMLNVLLCKVSMWLKLSRSLGLPMNILIEPTGECSYRCIKCARFAKDYKDDGPILGSKHMSYALFKDIMDDIGDTVLTLRLWHYGEALLNPCIVEMIRYAKKKNIFVALSTVLPYLLTEEKAEALVESGVDYCMVTIDASTKETYRLCHGIDNFENVIESVKRLVFAKKKLKTGGPLIEIQFVVMKQNEEEMPAMQLLAEELGIDKLSFRKLNSREIDFDCFSHVKTRDDVLPREKSYCLNETEIRSTPFCCLPWEETVVRYSGLVIPCAADHGQIFELGRIDNDDKGGSVRDVWNGKAYALMRRCVAQDISQNEMCQRCTKRNNTGKQTIEKNQSI